MSALDVERLACMLHLGVVTEKTPVWDVWMEIWPRVFGDPVVVERDAALKAAARQSSLGREMTLGDRLIEKHKSRVIEVITAMSKVERLALRDRVLGVREFPRVETQTAGR
jgi:hypothetical protein